MDAADFYTGIVVNAYAHLKSQNFDAGRYARFVSEVGQPGLELGCGDGQPLLTLIGAGLEVEGLDSSADMLTACRANAETLGLSVRLHHQRIEEMRIGRRFASIYLAGPTFNLLPDDNTAIAALQAIGDHLDQDGAALVPLWIPEPTPPIELGRSREATQPDQIMLRYTALHERLDSEARTRTTTVRYERLRPDAPPIGKAHRTLGGVRTREMVERDWVLHWHTPDGFRRLCGRAGVNVDITDGSCEPGAEFTAVLHRRQGFPRHI